MKPKSKGLYVSHIKKAKTLAQKNADYLLNQLAYWKEDAEECFKDGLAIGALFTALVGLILWALLCL